MNSKRLRPRHIIIIIVKVKNKHGILKAAKQNQLITYKVSPIKLSADFSVETLQISRGWHGIVRVLKEKKRSNQEFSLPSRLFRIEEEVKSFADNQKVKELITTKLAL